MVPHEPVNTLRFSGDEFSAPEMLVLMPLANPYPPPGEDRGQEGVPFPFLAFDDDDEEDEDIEEEDNFDDMEDEFEDDFDDDDEFDDEDGFDEEDETYDDDYEEDADYDDFEE